MLDEGDSGAGSALNTAPLRTHRVVQHYRFTSAQQWRSPLPHQLAGEAKAAALLLAARCTDHHLVRQANQLCDQQTHFPQALHWDPLSIAQGDLGQALLCSEL